MLFCVTRSLHFESSRSSREVNWVIEALCCKCLPAIDRAHIDLTGGERRPEQHRRRSHPGYIGAGLSRYVNPLPIEPFQQSQELRNHSRRRIAPGNEKPRPTPSFCVRYASDSWPVASMESVVEARLGLRLKYLQSRPRRRTMEVDQGHRVRAAAALGREEGTRSGIRGPSRSKLQAVKGHSPNQNTQQFSDLTARFAAHRAQAV